MQGPPQRPSARAAVRRSRPAHLPLTRHGEDLVEPLISAAPPTARTCSARLAAPVCAARSRGVAPCPAALPNLASHPPSGASTARCARPLCLPALARRGHPCRQHAPPARRLSTGATTKSLLPRTPAKEFAFVVLVCACERWKRGGRRARRQPHSTAPRRVRTSILILSARAWRNVSPRRHQQRHTAKGPLVASDNAQRPFAKGWLDPVVVENRRGCRDEDADADGETVQA